MSKTGGEPITNDGDKKFIVNFTLHPLINLFNVILRYYLIQAKRRCLIQTKDIRRLFKN